MEKVVNPPQNPVTKSKLQPLVSAPRRCSSHIESHPTTKLPRTFTASVPHHEGTPPTKAQSDETPYRHIPPTALPTATYRTFIKLTILPTHFSKSNNKKCPVTPSLFSLYALPKTSPHYTDIQYIESNLGRSLRYPLAYIVNTRRRIL